MLKKEFKKVTDNLQGDDFVASITIEAESKNGQQFDLVIRANTEHYGFDKAANISISPSLMSALGIAPETVSVITTNKPLIFKCTAMCVQESKGKDEFTSSTRSLPNNYYPTVISLVNELNFVLKQCIEDIAKERSSDGGLLQSNLFKTSDSNVVDRKSVV